MGVLFVSFHKGQGRRISSEGLGRDVRTSVDPLDPPKVPISNLSLFMSSTLSSQNVTSMTLRLYQRNLDR